MPLKNKIRSAFSSQAGIAHLLTIALLLGGVILAVVLVQTRTNIFPHAQQDATMAPQTAFHLLRTKVNNNKNWVTPDEEFMVNLAVSSDLESANTFSAAISYPVDLLEVIKIIKQPSPESNPPEPLPMNIETSASNISSYSGTMRIPAGPGCKISGCNGDTCVAENESGFSNCALLPEHVCYQKAKCEKQPTGQCGWTNTADLKQCLAGNFPKPTENPTPSYIKDYFIELWLPGEDFNNTTGKISLSGGVKNPGVMTSPPNKPIMATIVFKAKKTGEARLDFTEDSIILGSKTADNLLKSKYGLTLNIKDKSSVLGDMDGDGSVGFRDFSIWLSKWGTPDLAGDLNGDGKLNIFDFSILVSNWKK